MIYLHLKKFFRGTRFTYSAFLNSLQSKYLEGDRLCVSGKVSTLQWSAVLLLIFCCLEYSLHYFLFCYVLSLHFCIYLCTAYRCLRSLAVFMQPLWQATLTYACMGQEVGTVRKSFRGGESCYKTCPHL